MNYEIQVEFDAKQQGVEGMVAWMACVIKIDNRIYVRKNLTVRGHSEEEVRSKIHQAILTHQGFLGNKKAYRYNVEIEVGADDGADDQD